MVSMLLNKDPTKRMNLQQIKALPLFKGVDFETISEIESPIVKLLENHKK